MTINFLQWPNFHTFFPVLAIVLHISCIIILTTFHKRAVLSEAADAIISPEVGEKRTHIITPPWPANCFHKLQFADEEIVHSFMRESKPHVANK